MYLSKSKDYHGTGINVFKRFDPGMMLVLFIFFSYFAIRITGFYASSFQHPSNSLMWGVIAFVLILCCIILQVVFKRSIWTMCNVFFITSIMSHLMWYIKLPEAAYLFSELKEVGFLITFYLLGCITNKFCDFRMHKRLVLLCMAVLGILYVGIDILHMTMLTQSVAVITASILFVVFLLLSPAFSQHLFFADWSKEFRQINMSAFIHDTLQTNAAEQKHMPSLDDTSLSPREKQVVLLLLKGMTLRQVAPELGLTVSTVSTYSKAIYKKLGINSRAELFLLFGHPQMTEAIESIRQE
jgi:DNA-binding CsgD family transcriptional regulator